MCNEKLIGPLNKSRLAGNLIQSPVRISRGGLGLLPRATETADRLCITCYDILKHDEDNVDDPNVLSNELTDDAWY